MLGPIPKNVPVDVRMAIQQIAAGLDITATPTFTGLTLSSLTASRLIASDASKSLVSTDLNSWVSGTANEINITDDGDGTITIGIVDPLIVSKGGTGVATLTDHGILLGSGTGAITPLGVATNGQLPIGSAGADPVLATLTGTTNQVNVANGAGTITLSAPQDIATTSAPTFASLTLNGTATYGIDLSGGTWTADMNISTVGIIKAGGLRFIRVDNTNYNIFYGTEAFNNADGQYNVGMGYHAGYLNSMVGGAANGTYNIYIGYNSGAGTTLNKGKYNVGIGANSLTSNTTGFLNVTVGYNALTNNTIGTQNSAFGANSLYTNTYGANNTALGYATGYDLSGASYRNMLLGTESGRYLVSGSDNVLVGYRTGYGVSTVSTFSNNTFIGSSAGYKITTGGSNVFLGYYAGYYQTTASNTLLINNQDRTSAALELTNSLIYGVFNATPASQTLALNAVVTIPYGLNVDEYVDVDITNTVAAGKNCVYLDAVQATNALTGTLRGVYSIVTNGNFASSGTIRAFEGKARAANPSLVGGNVGTLEGMSLSADAKNKTVTTLRGAEIIMDGQSGAAVTTAVGLRISNNFQANIATTSYGLHIYRDSFDYTADILLSKGGTITGDSYLNQDCRTSALPIFFAETLQGEGSTAAGQLTVKKAVSAAGFDPCVRFMRSRNTLASPTQLQAGDTIGHFEFNVWDTAVSDYNIAVGFSAFAESAHGSGSLPSYFAIGTHDGTSYADRLVINSTGHACVGTSTTPNAWLSVKKAYNAVTAPMGPSIALERGDGTTATIGSISFYSNNGTKSYAIENNILAGDVLEFNKASTNLASLDATGILSTKGLLVTGITKLGDGGSTNYAQFAADGELNLFGTARVTRTVKFPLEGIGRGASAPTVTRLGDYYGYAFTIGDDGYFTFEPPHDRAAGTDMDMRIYWYCNEAFALNSGEVRWQIVWAATPDNETEAVDAPTHTGTVASGDQNIPATAKYLTHTHFTITGTNIGDNDIVGLLFSRIALTAGVNPTAEPVVVYAELYYTADKLGAAT